MKYGITQWSFANGIYALRLAAEAGFDGLQVETGCQTSGYYMREPEIQKMYLEDARRYGVELISVVNNDMMYVGCQGPKDGGEYKLSQKAISYTVETARDLGLNRIMLPFFHASQIHPDRPETFDRAVEVLKSACDQAASEGILVQAETSISTPRQRALLDAVGAKNLVSFYDTQNLYWFDGLEALNELPGMIPMNGPEMHLCDGWGRIPDLTNGAAPLGEGTANIEAQVRMICQSGWDGWLITENNYYYEPFWGKGSMLELAKRDLATVRRLVAQYS